MEETKLRKEAHLFPAPSLSKKGVKRIMYNFIVKKYFRDCKTILDVGSNTGIFIDVAKEHNKECSGIDLEPKREGVVRMDYRDLSEKVDGVFAGQFIEHTDGFSFMKKMQEIVRKKLVLVVPKANKSFWDYPDHVKPFTIKAIERLFKEYGFRKISAVNPPTIPFLHWTSSFIIAGKKV